MPDLEITEVVLVHLNIVNKEYRINMNKSSANINLSETPMSELVQSGALLRTDLPLMKNILKSLAKSGLIPLGETTAESGTDAAIKKNMDLALLR